MDCNLRADQGTDPSTPRPIPSGRVLGGAVTPPPSKSVTHRALNLSLLSGREAVVERPLLAQDTRLFLAALNGLGWRVEQSCEEVRLAPPDAPLAAGEAEVFCGNAGTMYRFLTASLAVVERAPMRIRLDGTPRLRERPVGPLLEALRALGAGITCPGVEGHAPLLIETGSLAGGRASLQAGESSQYLSALLMAALRAPGPTRLEVASLTSVPYVELTREAIRRTVPGDDPVRETPTGYEILPARPRVGRFRVEGDFSAACYPAAGAALTGGTVEIRGLLAESAQGDRRLFELLERMGASVAWRGDAVVVRGGRGLTAPGAVDLAAMPDQVPTLAALAPFAHGVTRIENVAHLRIKESDRLLAMATGLSALGVPVEERPDGLVIPGCWAERSGVVSGAETVIDPFDDHRIAMAFALVGLRRSAVLVAHPEVVAKSYPAFWSDLGSLLQADSC